MKKFIGMRLDDETYRDYVDYCDDNGYIIGTRMAYLMELDMSDDLHKPAHTIKRVNKRTERQEWMESVVGTLKEIYAACIRTKKPQQGHSINHLRMYGKGVIDHPSDRRIKAMIVDLEQNGYIKLSNGLYYYIPQSADELEGKI